MRRNIGLLMAAALAACGSFASNAFAVVSPREHFPSDIKPLPSRTVQIGGDGWFPTARGPGWTVAQVKRMARKQRNQKKHRAACRRNGGRKA